jgi:hypothetical protein
VMAVHSEGHFQPFCFYFFILKKSLHLRMNQTRPDGHFTLKKVD